MRWSETPTSDVRWMNTNALAQSGSLSRSRTPLEESSTLAGEYKKAVSLALTQPFIAMLTHERDVRRSVTGERTKFSVGWLQRLFKHSKEKADIRGVTQNANFDCENVYDSTPNVSGMRSSAKNARTRNATENDALSTRSTVHVQVTMLDGQSASFEVSKTLLTNSLLRRVCSSVGLSEQAADFFGLQIDSDRLRTWTWLNTESRVIKQLQKHGTLELQFQVRFYPPDTSYVNDEVFVYQMVLQIRHDLATGQLRCPASHLVLLTAYALQSEVGDYTDAMYQNGSSVLLCLPCAGFAIRAATSQRLTIDRFLEAVRAGHKSLQGLMPAMSDYKFLERACKLQLYGVRLHSALDARGVPILVGANYDGVHIYEEDDVGLRRLNRLSWPRIMRIHYQSKRLCIEVRGDHPSSRNVDVIFHLQTARVTKRTWCMLVENHIFYRLKTPRDCSKLSRSQADINRVSTTSPEWKTSSFGLWTLSAKSVSSLQSLVSPKSSKVLYGGKTLYESRQLTFSRRSGHRYWDAEKHSQCAAFQSAPCLLPIVERRPSTRPLPPLPAGVNSNRNSASLACNEDPNYAVIGVELTGARANGFNDSIGAYQVTAICRKESQYSTIKKYRNSRTQDHNAFTNERKDESESDSDSDTERIDNRQPSRETNIDDVDAIPYDF